MYSWLKSAAKQCDSGTRRIRGLPECVVIAHITCEDGGEWLQGIKGTFQSARLDCTGQQLEDAILRDGKRF